MELVRSCVQFYYLNGISHGKFIPLYLVFLLAFYDCAATSFDKQYVICSLDYCVLTMDYW